MSKTLFYNIGQLVTCSGGAKEGREMNELHIINNGAILVENGKILKVIREPFPNVSAEEKTDCRNKCVIPGLIDCHSHLIFAGNRAEEYRMRLQGKSYGEIMDFGGGIVATVEPTRKADKEELKARAKNHLKHMLAHGVTTLEVKSGYGLDLKTEIKQLEIIKELNEEQPVELIPTFLGAHAFPVEYKDNKDGYVDLIVNEMLKKIKERNLAVFCDVFCEPTVFTLSQSERLLLEAEKLGFKLKIHADEMTSYGGAKLAAKLNAVSADHLLLAKKEDLLEMKEKGVVAVVLPATAFSLKEPYADARFMIDNGLVVAVAGDFNPGSCYCDNFSFVQALSVRNMNMTQEEVISAITVNSAKAVGRDDLGSIEEGKQADFCILEDDSYLSLSYRLAESSIQTVYKKGKQIYDRG